MGTSTYTPTQIGALGAGGAWNISGISFLLLDEFHWGGMCFEDTSITTDSQSRITNHYRDATATLTLSASQPIGPFLQFTGTYSVWAVPGTENAAYGNSLKPGTRDEIRVLDDTSWGLTDETQTVTLYPGALIQSMAGTYWNGRICLSVYWDGITSATGDSGFFANTGNPPILSVTEGPVVLGHEGNEGRTRLVFDDRTGLPMYSKNWIRDGYNPGLRIDGSDPENYDIDDPPDRYRPNPAEGVIDDEPGG